MNNLLQSLKNIISVSPMPMAVVDKEMRYLAVAEQWITLYGLENEPMIGRSHYDVFPEIDERWKEIHSNCLGGKDQRCDNDRFERADGTVMWLKWEVRHWVDEDGKIGGMMMSSEDITYKTKIFMNETRFQLFMDDFPGLCWIIDHEKVFKYANKSFYDTFNLTSGVIDKNTAVFFTSDIAKHLQEHNQSVLKSGKGKVFHQTIRDHQGIPQVFKTHKFPFAEAGVEMVGAVAFNITKSKQLEEELFRSETQFKIAFEHSPIGMALTSPDGNWKRVNKSLCQMLGYTAGEMKKLKFQDLTHADDLTKSVTGLNDLGNGKIDRLKYEKRYIHKDGSTIWTVIAVTPLFDRLGEPLYYVSQIEDITRRKKIENDLVLSEKKFRAIFENVQDVFYQTDPNGLLTEISPSIEKYSGYARSEMIGRPVTDFYLYAEDRERFVETLGNKGFVTDFEVLLKSPIDTPRYASVNARLIFENGTLLTTDGSMRDVTVRKLQENILKTLNMELTASNKQKNNLLSIIGHDLRNPISGSLQLLTMTMDDYESSTAGETQISLSIIREELSGANNLLENLLEWAKSQRNAVSFNPSQVKEMNGLVDRCIQAVSVMSLKKKIVITSQVADGLSLFADTGMLETVIRNLLSNAIKFTHISGEIVLTAVGNDDGVWFSISDNGQGIPKDKIAGLFIESSQYTTFGTQGEKGTGLGLNLCYEFVHKHGGKIWVESIENKGSTFYFSIPNALGI
jgi:PAS domain S-box-containing protein